MFAPSLPNSLHSALANHVFGRFTQAVVPAMPPSASASAPGSAHGFVEARSASSTEALDTEVEIDLAQRVRDVGEW